ncbi:hypothetical protein SAMN02745127_02492 [Oceanospirillum multiglobuliferum]|uniref:Uncharacterized protein n=1 Tax=Oceanospirillum multiglobuliferum TaxID=64969 RepID=A0A1T4RPS4_9GAMM|nr:hypothetical protein [Oceanospirillum multiglobuliferum]OPX54661.1 hypothetical protein BTE48_12820 [Oceanospirillum multiglobuliferum]SKA17796.1 hypothetical protein SAMN02745127_02492 [Oceanospirillum multiglobuliferum]
MNTAPLHHGNKNNVIDLFSRSPVHDPKQKAFVRIAPELDGLAMVYSHPSDPHALFALRLIGWGLQRNGKVVGIVPWLENIIPATDAEDPRGGRWQGYYDLESDTVFTEPPEHKVLELRSAYEAYEYSSDLNPESFILQEMPDSTGTHIVSLLNESDRFQVMEIFSWRLFGDGRIEAMLIDETQVVNTPVLLGDDCLFPASEVEGTNFYFQYQIANQIKRQEPEAMQALIRMMYAKRHAASV